MIFCGAINCARKDICVSEKEKEQLIERVGAIKAFKMISGLSDAARYSLYKQIRDTKAYELTGKDWKTFCIENLKSSQNTINEEIKFVEGFGESFLNVAEHLGLKKKDLYALDKGFSVADKIAIKEGAIMDGARKILITKDNYQDIADMISKLVDKTKEAESQATQAKSALESKYNTTKSYEKKYLAEKQLRETAEESLKRARQELGFMGNPTSKEQKNFLAAIDRNFRDTHPIFLFIDQNISQIEKLRKHADGPMGYPPKSEVALRTLIKYIFELSRLYFNKLEMLVADTEEDMIDPKYVSGLEREVKEDWAHTIWPGPTTETDKTKGENGDEQQQS